MAGLYTLAALASLAMASEGGQPGDVFSFAASARALAMGGATTALSHDSASVSFNPAGLGNLQDRHLSLMHAALHEGFAFSHLAYGQPLLGGAVAMQFLRLGAGGVEGRDELNRQTGDLGYSETGFGLGGGYAGLLGGRLAAGLAAKMLQRSLGGFSNRLMGLDAGVQYRPLDWTRRLRLGLVAQNALAASSKTQDVLPRRLRAGAAFELAPGLHLAADLSSERTFAIGTEYDFWKIAAFRLGLQGSDLSFGAGLLWRGVQLDYAATNNAALGLSNRISLGWRLGREKAQPEAAKASDIWKQGLAALQDQNYVLAARLLQSAIDLEPAVASGAQWGMARRLRELAQGLELEAKPYLQEELVQPSKASHLAHQAIMADLGGNARAALLFAQAALGSNPSADSLRALLAIMESRGGLKAPRDEILPPEDLLNVKMKKLMQSFYTGRLQAALGHCEDILSLDPANAGAWTKLGSLHFALGSPQKAREAYRKALELDPANAQVADFMRRKGWR